jgi:hypothetical protein
MYDAGGVGVVHFIDRKTANFPKTMMELLDPSGSPSDKSLSKSSPVINVPWFDVTIELELFGMPDAEVVSC